MTNLNLIKQIAALSKTLAEDDLTDDERDDIEAKLYDLEDELESEEESTDFNRDRDFV